LPITHDRLRMALVVNFGNAPCAIIAALPISYHRRKRPTNGRIEAFPDTITLLTSHRTYDYPKLTSSAFLTFLLLYLLTTQSSALKKVQNAVKMSTFQPDLCYPPFRT
jgi:hypothetical protein